MHQSFGESRYSWGEATHVNVTCAIAQVYCITITWPVPCKADVQVSTPPVSRVSERPAMRPNPFVPFEIGYVTESALIQTKNDYIDILEAIRAYSSYVTSGLRMQIEEALHTIEAELAFRAMRILPVSN